MKGVPGLLVALAVGVVGAFCNWLYLAGQGENLRQIDFIGIADGVKINPGDKFSEAHFAKISIPQDAALRGKLDKTAYLWSDMSTVVGESATKIYGEGEILLRQDVHTPPDLDIKKLLAPDERALWIPVDTRTFVPALVSAGDQVSFVVPRMSAGGPTPVGGDVSVGATAPATSNTEIIGPFRILALGTRLGSQQVLRAAGMTPTQENVMAVAVRIVGGDFDEKGQKVLEILRLTNFQQAQVILHPAPEAGKAK